MKYLILFAITTAIFFLVDMLWLGVLAKNFYREKLAFVFTGQVNWTAAVIFYFIYIAGILYFVVVPGLNGGSAGSVLLNGALLGLLCYATYDLTNMATIRQWPLVVVVVDIAWGGVLTGAVSYFAWLAGSRFWH